jgi:hypothetical protein
MTVQHRHAHRPEPRWRWYAGLALEVAVFAAVCLFFLIVMSVAP